MKRFAFRLEPLLKVKAHLERERQKEHALAVNQVLKQRERLSEIAASRESMVSRQRRGIMGRISVAEMLVYSRYLLKLRKNSLAGSETLRGLERTAEEKRLALVDAAKERQIYEKLKERQQERYDKEALRQEQKESDEIAVSRYYVSG